MEDRPERIEAEIFPFKFQKVNVGKMLDELAGCPQRFIIRYRKGLQNFIQITNFLDHQYPHLREADSTIPAPDKHSARHSQDRLNPESLSSESPILNADKTPSAPKRNGAATPFWKELVAHLNDTWSRKKRGAKYVWSMKDFAALKRVLAVYQPFDVMALWDIYIGSDDDFAKRQGYNVPEFIRQMPRLVDGAWKPAAKTYEDKFLGPIGDVGKMVSDLAVGKAMAR
jgi:hypothetical protein